MNYLTKETCWSRVGSATILHLYFLSALTTGHKKSSRGAKSAFDPCLKLPEFYFRQVNGLHAPGIMTGHGITYARSFNHVFTYAVKTAF